jgi:hypothetical protein
MYKDVLTSMSLAGLLAVSLAQGIAAAPIAPPAAPVTAVYERPLEQIYYYHGRYYPYHYHGRYYANRAYRYGRWHYY